MWRNPRIRALLGVALLALAAAAAMQGLEAWSDARLGAEVAANARAGDIRMLASDTCPYCAQARAWFEAHNVAYSECSIERDEACAATWRAVMAPGTPVLLVRGRRLVGFDARAVAAALAPG